MQVHLTRVYRTKKDKKGNPLKTRDGREYERISIKTQEHGDKWLSGFGASWNDNWNDGDLVSVEVVQSGEYLNFNKVDPVNEMEQRIKRLEDAVFGTGSGKVVREEDGPDGEPKIEDDDIPF